MPSESAGSAAVPPKLSLKVVAGPCADALVASAGFNLTVGRTKASKLHIKDSSVSEKHARVSWNGRSWVIRDTNSSNGTAVNGQQLQALVDVIPLKDGDEVLFGLESRAIVKLESRTVGELTVDQMLACACEAAAQSVEIQGHAHAKELLVALSQGKAQLKARLEAHAAAA